MVLVDLLLDVVMELFYCREPGRILGRVHERTAHAFAELDDGAAPVSCSVVDLDDYLPPVVALEAAYLVQRLVKIVLEYRGTYTAFDQLNRDYLVEAHGCYQRHRLVERLRLHTLGVAELDHVGLGV